MVLGQRPTGSRLRWLPRELPKVPLDVAATGPKVIEMAAAIAERVTFSVGASPERVRWALDLARNARKTQGLGAEGPSYGLQIIVVCHPDREAVRAAASSIVAPLARFQVIQGDAAGPVSGCDAEAFAAVQKGYDMTKHDVAIAHDKIKGAALSWDFVQRFAIIGPPDYCTERILQLTALGIEHLKIVGPGYHPEAYENDPGLFVKEVMPAVRAATRPDS
jgi:5,10-methylenetetrahydromethanopterin reductase